MEIYDAETTNTDKFLVVGDKFISSIPNIPDCHELLDRLNKHSVRIYTRNVLLFEIIIRKYRKSLSNPQKDAGKFVITTIEMDVLTSSSMRGDEDPLKIFIDFGLIKRINKYTKKDQYDTYKSHLKFEPRKYIISHEGIASWIANNDRHGQGEHINFGTRKGGHSSMGTDTKRKRLNIVRIQSINKKYAEHYYFSDDFKKLKLQMTEEQINKVSRTQEVKKELIKMVEGETSNMVSHDTLLDRTYDRLSNLPKVARPFLKCEGKETEDIIELDISCSHPTILNSLTKGCEIPKSVKTIIWSIENIKDFDPNMEQWTHFHNPITNYYDKQFDADVSSGKFYEIMAKKCGIRMEMAKRLTQKFLFTLRNGEFTACHGGQTTFEKNVAGLGVQPGTEDLPHFKEVLKKYDEVFHDSYPETYNLVSRIRKFYKYDHEKKMSKLLGRMESDIIKRFHKERRNSPTNTVAPTIHDSVLCPSGDRDTVVAVMDKVISESNMQMVFKEKVITYSSENKYSSTLKLGISEIEPPQKKEVKWIIHSTCGIIDMLESDEIDEAISNVSFNTFEYELHNQINDEERFADMEISGHQIIMSKEIDWNDKKNNQPHSDEELEAIINRSEKKTLMDVQHHSDEELEDIIKMIK